MTKKIIISGPAASGKSWIARAIQYTHKKKAEGARAESLIEMLESDKLKYKLLKRRSMIIVEECSIEDIKRIDFLMNSNIPIITGHSFYPIVFLTQDEVKRDVFNRLHFHVINCRNHHY